MAHSSHEVAEAGRAAAEDFGRRGGLLHDAVDGVGRAAQLQAAVCGRPEPLEGRAHPEDRILQPVVPQRNCKKMNFGDFVILLSNVSSEMPHNTTHLQSDKSSREIHIA